MGTTTTAKAKTKAQSGPSSNGTQSLSEQRDALISVFNTEREAQQAAAAKGDKKVALSHGAKMANRSREIRAIELEMAAEGVQFEAWSKPQAPRRSSTPPPSQEQLTEDLAKMGRIYHGPFAETTKHSADQRITALLKLAKKHGYSGVKDPRKK